MHSGPQEGQRRQQSFIENLVRRGVTWLCAGGPQWLQDFPMNVRAFQGVSFSHSFPGAALGSEF